MDLVKYKNGESTTTSKVIGEVFGKSHKHVLDAIRRLECSSEFREPNFRPSSYTSSQNKELGCFDITKDGFVFLAMSFTGKEAATWKEAYIKAFNDMERHIVKSPSVMTKINETIKMLEDDREKASACASGLSQWRKIKRVHNTEIKRLVTAAQLILNLEA